MRSISGFSNSQLTIVSIRTTTGYSLSFKNKTADFTLKGLGTSENSRLGISKRPRYRNEVPNTRKVLKLREASRMP